MSFIVREAIVNEEIGSIRYFRVQALPNIYETRALAWKMASRFAAKMEAQGGFSDGVEVYDTVRREPAYYTTTTVTDTDEEIPF